MRGTDGPDPGTPNGDGESHQCSREHVMYVGAVSNSTNRPIAPGGVSNLQPAQGDGTLREGSDGDAVKADWIRPSKLVGQLFDHKGYNQFLLCKCGGEAKQLCARAHARARRHAGNKGQFGGA